MSDCKYVHGQRVRFIDEPQKEYVVLGIDVVSGEYDIMPVAEDKVISEVSWEQLEAVPWSEP